jgi:hypothetical protein
VVQQELWVRLVTQERPDQWDTQVLLEQPAFLEWLVRQGLLDSLAGQVWLVW